ncbi:hypothetical protein C2845_PM09G15160 [Panicum miliaceum]|uniref:RING-type E3 ubiquitin transferase n=1 Tax=Panicum miliaceum TaxID=4540 RepID=A0A3L6S3K8_PANMI|nr:hypothetical protein C2845_PM09G15160 [Panicum miliaceum]
MILFSGRGAFFVRIACVVLVPASMMAGSMLYFIGFRWGLSILVVVTVLFCLHWPFVADHIGDDGGGSLPVRQVQQRPPGSAHADMPVQPRCVGLGASAIAALPAYSYEKKAGGDECAVCLGELQRGEVVKQLPACAHLFHDGCIDAWLRSHVTCPVCRSLVDASPPVAAGIVLRTE